MRLFFAGARFAFLSFVGKISFEPDGGIIGQHLGLCVRQDSWDSM